MNLLYLSYWGLADGLTQATVLPNLNILLNSHKVQQVVFVTIERGPDVKASLLPQHQKLIHVPLISKNYPVNLLNKVNDFLLFPKRLSALIDEYSIARVIARGSPAGALIHKICQKKNIPFYVESFEPHADYMLESGVWSSYDPRYLFERRWENEIKGSASGLMPVARNYQEQLVKEGVDKRNIFTVPCGVNLDKFTFCPTDRQMIRRKLEIGDRYTGVYVGKFGGIYYAEEAFMLFRRLLQVEPFLYFIIITPDDHSVVLNQLHKFNLPKNQFFISTVPHKEVPLYLSAADFALATIKPSPSRKYCSAIKVGEYWANGLPVLITEGVGDDSDIITNKKAGVVLNNGWEKQPDSYFANILGILKKCNDRKQIREIALENRSTEQARMSYDYFNII